MNRTEPLASRPRMLKEIANRYGVSSRTFLRWLRVPALEHLINNKVGYYYSVQQIRQMVEHLGEPE